MLHSVKVMHIVVLSSTSSEGHCKEIPTKSSCVFIMGMESIHERNLCQASVLGKTVFSLINRLFLSLRCFESYNLIFFPLCFRHWQA